MLKATFLQFAAALLTTSTAPGLSQPSQSQAPAKPVGEIRREIISLAAQIVSASKSLSEIWPGYWPEDQAFIIHAEGVGALLISPGPRPASFEPVSASELPEVLREKAYFHKGTLSGAERPFVLNHPIGEGKTGLLVNWLAEESAKTIGLILHEQFHAFQATRWKRGEAQFVDPLAVTDRVAFAAAAEVEREILAAALASQAPEERLELLRQYFAVRREREQTIPAEVVKVEQGFERVEGTAKYAESRGQAAIDGPERSSTAGLIIADLSQSLALEARPYIGTWFRGRSYGTGAALTYLISQFGGNTWQGRIESGEKLDSILESLIGPRPVSHSAALAKAARSRFGYDAKVRELAPSIRASEKDEIKSVSEFLSLAPFHLVFEPGAAGASARPGFQAMTMTLLSPKLIVLPLAMRFHVPGDSFSITSRDGPVMLDSGKPERYTFGLQSAPSIQGAGPLPAGEYRMKSLNLSREGFELKVDRPVVVRVEGNRIVVAVDPGAAKANPHPK